MGNTELGCKDTRLLGLNDKQKDLYLNFNGKVVDLCCMKCGKHFTRKVRRDRPNTYLRFLCSKCGREETSLKKFGVKSNLILVANPKKVWEEQHDKIIEKRNKTSMLKFGSSSSNQNLSVIQKMQDSKSLSIKNIELEKKCLFIKTVFKLYGSGWYQTGAFNEGILKVKGVRFVKNDYLPLISNYYESGKCHTNSYVSKKEKELLYFIKDIYKGNVIENDTSTVPNLNHRYFELDIYLPDLKIGIDFDGDYYHSTRFKDKYYHQRKTMCAYNVGVRLAHVLEYDWDNRKDEIKSKLKELILNRKSFSDGYFPSFSDEVHLSEPRERIIGKYIYYDTGVLDFE